MFLIIDEVQNGMINNWKMKMEEDMYK